MDNSTKSDCQPLYKIRFIENASDQIFLLTSDLFLKTSFADESGQCSVISKCCG